MHTSLDAITSIRNCVVIVDVDVSKGLVAATDVQYLHTFDVSDTVVGWHYAICDAFSSKWVRLDHVEPSTVCAICL